MATALAVAALSIAATLAHAQIYHDGVSPKLTGVYEFGTFMPNYIGGTVQDGFGAPITGQREYIYDVNGPLDPLTAGSFNLVVYKFSTPKDSVRLYTSQDHYFGGPIDNSLAPEVMEYSVWGSMTGGTSQSDWVMLSNPIGWSYPTAGKPVYTFEGLNPAAEIFRGGSFEGGIANAYTQDYSFADKYLYFGIRGSSIAMAAITADPELDTMVAFNRADVGPPGGPVPESSVTVPFSLALLGLCAVAKYGPNRRRRDT